MTTLQLTHEGNQHIFRTKHLLREKVCWHGTDRDVEHLIRSYISCQAQGPTPSPARTSPHVTNTSNSMESFTYWFVRVVFDCQILSRFDWFMFPSAGSFHDKEHDYGAIIKKMKSCFATHGLPAEIVTDNGRQFTSEEFESYCSANGIKHRHVTPYCPQANSKISSL